MDSNSYSKPPLGRKMKNPAPPPPGPPQAAPRCLPRNIVPDGGVAVSAEMKENVLRPRVELQLNLPNGAHTTSTFDGRKALMDLLVEVCGQYHLNPAYHTLELLSSEGQPVAFKPNAFLGSLDVACALIKERVVDEKLVRKPAPRVPEKTVRLVVNYHRSQKTVVRVNPLVPLHALVPAICQKCEFDPVHVLLLRDSVSRHELDLNKSLSDLEIRELYALDQSLVLQPKMASAPVLNYAESTCSTQSVGTVEKKGLLGFFKFNRRKSKTDSLSSSDLEEVDGDAHVVESAGNDQYTLSGVSTSLEARPSTLGQSQSVMNISKMSPKAELKKRRAPAPPPHTSQSYGSLEMQSGSASTSSLLKKRKAPAPPPTPASRTPTPTPTPPARGPDDDAHQAAPQTSSSSLTTATIASATATATAVTTATVVLPPVAAVRRVAAPQEDSVSEVSGSSEESERAAALCSSSSSQADSVPSSHLDEVAISSQDEEEEYEDVEEEEEEEEEGDGMEMELQLQVLQQLQQKSRQQFSQTKPVEVERLQQQQHHPSAQTLTAQGLHEYQASEPKPQQQQPQPAQQQLPQQPQVPKHQEQSEEQLRDSDRSTTSADSSSTLSLRIEESENNRHSAIDAGRQAPVKPRRTPLGDQTFRAASASPALIERNSHNSSPDSFTDMQRHSWLHSAHPAGGAEVQVDSVETGSMSSSSGSFADQGYAASEGTAEDPCPLGSPSDLSPPHVPRDASSDSDEGCATWNSRTSQKGQAGKVKNSFEEDPKLMAQLQLTLADLDAELAEMNNSIESPSEADDVIPVSVVDLVPVTTIDEVSDMQLSNRKNKNNNATLCVEPVVQPHVSAEVRGSRTKKEVKQEVRQEVKQLIPASKAKTHKSEPPVCENKAGSSATGTQSSSVLAPPKAQPVSGSQSSRAPPRAEEVSQERSKITQIPASRFGTKTFTIVPNKVTVPSIQQTQGSLSLGAIKIDEQGNMMRGGVQQRVRTLAEQGDKKEEVEKAAPAAMPLGGKAKAFWTSTDKQEAPAATKTTKTTTTAASAVFRKPDVSSKPAQGGVIIKPADKPQPQPTASSSVSLRNTSSTAKDGSQAPRAVESRPPSSEPAGPTQRATPGAQDARDLSFLKPQKRTSSQYMATALSSKFTVRPAARADGIQEKPEPEPSTPVPAQKRSVEVRTTTTTLITSSVSKHSNGSTEVVLPKENGSVSSWSITRSPPAYRSHAFTKQTTVEPPRPLQVGAGTASEVDSVVVNKTMLTTHAPANKTETTHKPPSVQLDQNPEPWSTSGVLPDANQVSLFGPVKKFRPVIQKSIEKDTSLHSSLMEAIQSGDSKDRLRKVSAGSALKKPAPVEEENSHSALLSAIRANHSSQLKKTRSEAARELDHFRASESERSVSQIHTSSPPHTSPPPAPAPPVSAPPPPLPPPAAAPPLGPLVSAGNPEQSREAMLEAIRSGAGAKALKRVPVTTKTVQVNGRLGTMKASCSLSQS